MYLFRALSFFLVVLFFWLVPTPVHAAEEKIQSFNVIMTANKDGSLDIQEDITYNFGNLDRHGIFRIIPIVSRVGDLYRKISISFTSVIRNGKPERYQVSNESSEITAKIGDPNRTISGIHKYTIIYRAQNAIGSNYSDHDEIYWNVTGNEWKIPIDAVSFSINPGSLNLLPDKARCFTGTPGSALANCTIPSNSTLSPIRTTAGLSRNEGLTVVLSYPVNTFPKSELSTTSPLGGSDTSNLSTDTASEGSGVLWYVILFGYLLLNLIVAPIFIFRFAFRTKPYNLGKVTVNFDIPRSDSDKRIAPAEAGIVDQPILEINDVTATIFDLAIRKYVKLVEKKEKGGFLGIGSGKLNPTIEKVEGKNWDQLTDFEQTLLERLFRDGSSVNISSLKSDFYKTYSKMQDEVFNSMVNKGYMKENPQSKKSMTIFLAIICFVTFNILMAIALIILYRKITGRTKNGDVLDWKIDGLKVFLKAMHRYYNFQTKNLITIEEYIPYALALGCIKEFMEELKTIAPDYEPSWYVGSNWWVGFDNYNTSISSNMVTSAPSSSSGFSSGGGFSGGGGGGGGGRSW